MITSIVIATFNKLEYTQQCIESIRKYTESGSYELIVVDNHSTDGTVDWLRLQEDIKTIFNDQNLGFPKACNQGIEIAIGDNVLLLNNDTVVTENWLSNLVVSLHSSAEIGAVGAITNNCSNLQTIPVSYSTIEEMQVFAARINQSVSTMWEERLRLIGYCMLIKKSIIDQIGLLDERFTPGNYEDDDYSMRIRQAGFKLLLCKDTFIHHYGSVSFREVSHSYKELMQRNSNKYTEKWGFQPDEANPIDLNYINAIDRPKNSYFRVLHMGCGLGGTLLKIKHTYPNAEVFGYEINESIVQAATKSVKISLMDIEHIQDQLEKNYFDYIIVQDPLVSNVVSLMEMLKEDGTLITIYPHLLHHNVIRDMISGAINRQQLQALTIVEVEQIFRGISFDNFEITGIVTDYLSNADKQFLNSLTDIVQRDNSKINEVIGMMVKAKRIDKVTEMKYIINQVVSQADLVYYVPRLAACDEQKIRQLVENSGAGQVVEMFNYLAVQLLDQEYLNQALAYLKAAFELDQGNSTTVFNLGLTMYRMGHFVLALDWFELLPEKNEQVLGWMSQIRHEIAVQV
ncbi:glycosyltransferase [Cohnella sp. WQ 127256]|uniref:glycosyltransferase n=1 Tax=Cohnella sp. WQ 127256 TaxID=2938790 RepID=UPI0021196750